LISGYYNKNINVKKVFIKLNLYNSIWIKGGDKWKIAFTIPERSFKRNLINTGEIASFIDNIIVKTKKKEEYGEVIEE